MISRIQAGLAKVKAIYNASGDVVATRYNNDPWTCTTYDARGRVQSTIIPVIGSSPSRTITNDYAKDGNPLITATTDDQGTIRVENDLLGRTVKYTDTNGKLTTNTYDDYGKITQRVSPVGTETYQYDNYDRLTTQSLDGTTYATVTYDAYGRIANVQYPAGMSLSSITRDTLGRENGNTYTLANSQNLTDQITRYTSGDIQNGTELGTNKSYQYDKAGRLTNATIGNNTYTYGFDAQDPSCPTYTGYDAGKDGNRTKLTVNGQVTTYCYDAADRLVSSSDPTLTDAQYDAHGNTTSLGDTAHQTTFTYDSSDRNIGLASGAKQTTYTRDVQNRITSRQQKVNGTVTITVNYGFTGSSDTPDYLLDGSGNVTQKYITLPGDVMVTMKPNATGAGATTYSLPNIHGDIFATVDGNGTLLSAFMTGAFGEVLPNAIAQPSGVLSPTTNPTNTADGTLYGYVGQHEKMTDTETSPILGGVIQMGARVYIPGLGRFLSVDQQEGGAANNYAYMNDPVNESDLTGEAWWNDAWKFVGKHADEIGIGVAAVGFGVCVIATAGACGIAAGVAAVASAGLAAAQVRYNGGSWGKAAGSAAVSGLTDFAMGKVKFGEKAIRNFGKAAPKYYGTVKNALSTKGARTALSTATGRARALKFTTKAVGSYFVGQYTQYHYGKITKRYR